MTAFDKLDPADVADRVARYGTEWRANIQSTEPADRPRAEAALRALYRESGQPAPRVQWVPSPAAGLLAAGFAAHSREWIRGQFTRGDIGSGRNQHWNAVANPFEVERAWQARLTGRVENRIGRWEHRRESSAAVLRAYGVESLVNLRGAVVTAAQSRAAEQAADKSPTTLDAPIVDQTADVLLGTLWTSVVETTGLELGRELFVSALRQATDSVISAARSSREATRAMQPGQFDTRTPLLAAIRDCFGEELWRGPDRDKRQAPIEAVVEISRSAGPWWALKDLVIISERPLTLAVDERGRPHSDRGPAMAWADGLELWARHGVRVAPFVITHPEQITIQQIDAEANAEVRRVLVEQFGGERLIREGGAQLVHEDGTGRLWRRRMPTNGWGNTEEPIVMVEVLNSTPEPDGTRKTYFLRVPPNMLSARQAVAWTFELSPIAYRPAVET